MDWSTLWAVVVPPVAGGIIGYFTNDLAITMLFRPYRVILVGGQPLPFTPGLIPRNQERLATRIADTIMRSLLTPEELQNLTRRLLQTERVQGAIQWLLELALDQIKVDTEQKNAKILANILRDILGQSFPRLITVLARREDFLETQLNHIFDQVLLELQLTEDQASKLADWLLEVVIPPDVLRQNLIDFLTDRNIQIIDEGFREKTSGTYWVVANLFGARNALLRLRTFLIEEREAANVRLSDLMVSLGLKQRLTEGLQNLSLQGLPVSTVRQLRKNFRDTIRGYIQTSGLTVLQGLSDSLDWDNIAALILSRLQSSNAVASSLELVSQELALILERYLERDLEAIVARVIPILNLDQVIIERVRSTSPEELEQAIQGIVKTELQAIVRLGGFLGFMIGLLQTLILLWR